MFARGRAASRVDAECTEPNPTEAECPLRSRTSYALALDHLTSERAETCVRTTSPVSRGVSELAVDRRHGNTLRFRAEQLALEPRNFALESADGRGALSVDGGELLAKIGEQLLLCGDQRLLLRDDLAESFLALERRGELRFEPCDSGITRVRHEYGVSRA